MNKLIITATRSNPNTVFWNPRNTFKAYRTQRYVTTGKIVDIIVSESITQKTTIIEFKDTTSLNEWLDDSKYIENTQQAAEYNQQNGITTERYTE